MFKKARETQSKLKMIIKGKTTHICQKWSKNTIFRRKGPKMASYAKNVT